MSTITRRAPSTRSIAPPIPRMFLPGIPQLAMSPDWLTWNAPRMAVSMCPPRIIAKLEDELKNEPPGRTVTVCFPALMVSGSNS